MVARLCVLVSLLLVILGACGSPTASPADDAATDSQQAGGSAQGACVSASAAKEMPSGRLDLVIATGGTGGVYYPYGGGIARILSAKMSNTAATAEVTSASVDNMKLIMAEETDLAFTLADTAYDAFSGRASFQDIGPVPVCAIAKLYTNYLQIIASADSGVETVADLQGKRVSVGSAGSGTEVIANRVLAAAGLDPQSDITRDNLSASESVGALKDGKIDAFFWSGGVPTGAVTDLMATPNLSVTFVPSADLVESLKAEWGPLYAEASIPKDGYSGLQQDVPVVGVNNLLTVNAGMPEQLAYDILTTLFTNLSDVHAIHPEAGKLSPEAAVEGSSIPFHPGAITFYSEQGVWEE